MALVPSLLSCQASRLRQAIKEPNCNIYNPPDAAFRRTNRNIQMKTEKCVRKAGFTLVEIMIVVAIIGLLAAIAIPNFVKARATSQANACINNMRQIDAAANEWALEAKKTTGATVSWPNDLTALHQVECDQQNSRLPGRRHLHGGRNREPAFSDLLVELDGDSGPHPPVIVDWFKKCPWRKLQAFF